MNQIAHLDWPLVVLHDIHGEAMTRFDRFLSTLKDAGYSFRQDMPASTIVIHKDRPTEALDSVLAI